LTQEFQVKDQRTKQYGLVFLRDIDHPDFRALKPATRLVYFSLIPYVNAKSGAAWPKQTTLAKVTGLSVRSIRRAVSELEGAAFIAVNKKKVSAFKTVNLYTLLERP
jgi:hypothetical protein